MAFTRQRSLIRRHQRVRRKISGTAARPRLCIHKSLRHLYAQLIDDDGGRTLAFATTNNKAHKAQAKSCCNQKNAEQLAADLVAQAKEKGIEQVVFDRGGYRYHGIVKAFGDAARKAGLKF